MTKTVIISTVGTSLFNNYMRYRSDNPELSLQGIKEYFDDLEKIDVNQLNTSRQYDGKANTIKERLVPNIFDYLGEKASAEIASISKFVSDRNLKKEDVILYFIISDTAHSMLAAQIVSSYLNDRGFCVDGENSLKIVRGLSVMDGDDFEKKGLPNLAETICNIRNDKELSKEKPQFFINITGGYKGVLPYMYLIAQMYEIPTFYIYENSEDLIYLPQMPLAFSSEMAEEYYYFLKDNDKIENLDEEEFLELQKYGFIKKTEAGNIKRSGMGDVFCQWVESKAPESRTTIGKFIEYKLVETYEKYLHNRENYNQENPEYIISRVFHSDKKLLDPHIGKTVTGQEIDILLTYKNNRKEAVEIKSFMDFLGRGSENIENQFVERLKLVTDKKLNDLTLIFMLYYHLPLNELKSKFKSIEAKKQHYRQLAGNIPVKFKYVEINRCSSSKEYTKFLDKIINIRDIKDL